MSKRGFLKTTVGASMLVSGGILVPSPVRAILPALVAGTLARFVVQGFVRSTITRSVGSAAIRGGVRQTLTQSSKRLATNGIRKRVTQKTVTEYGISLGTGVSISADVFALAKESNAAAIWVDREHDNHFDMEFTNSENRNSSGQLSLFVQDVATGQIIDQLYEAPIALIPTSSFKFSFTVSDLPYTGVVQLLAASTIAGLDCTPSENIVIAGADDVIG